MALYGAAPRRHGRPARRRERPPDTSSRRPATAVDLTTSALIFLLARAFSSGCAALTGVEAISNGVPAFRKPKSRNAATTLLLLGTIAITMLLSIIVLANKMGLKYVDPNDIDRLRDPDGKPLPAGLRPAHRDRADRPRRCSTTSRPASTSCIAMTGIILVLAANTAFNGFPVLGSILARDGFVPRALGSRGDRLAYSNGIVFLAVLGDRPDRRLRRRDDPADPALHRRRLRLVQPQPARHDPALDPAPEDRDRPGGPAPDVPLAGDQHLRPRHDRRRVRDRAAHQVPGRRLDRDPRDGASSSCS